MFESNDGRQFLYSDQMVLIGKPDIVGYGSAEFYLREISRSVANKLILENHYSHKITNHSRIHLGVYMSGVLVGALQFGYAMNPASGANIVPGTANDGYLELNRMWLDDVAPRNSESMAISYAIKYIKKREPQVKWIQSFADERCGKNGIVYQAANFQYYGEHSSIFWTLDGVVYHNIIMTRRAELTSECRHLQSNRDRATSENLRQFRYLYFIDKRLQATCNLSQKPYEKHYDDEVVVDV